MNDRHLYRKGNRSLTAQNVCNKMNIGMNDGATDSQAKKALYKYGLNYTVYKKIYPIIQL